MHIVAMCYVYFNSDVPNKKIKELVQTSYRLVWNALSKKERETL